MRFTYIKKKKKTGRHGFNGGRERRAAREEQPLSVKAFSSRAGKAGGCLTDVNSFILWILL